MKTAQQAAQKFVARAAVASSDYAQGVRESTKDQNAAAIAAADNYKTAVIEAANAGRFAAGLRKAGKQKYLDGVAQKGESRFSEGVAAGAAAYASESARFDTARNAAASLPRGPRGDARNLARVAAVANAQRAVRVAASK